mmetsp:Transcript_89467/g.208351  ORF Transcript_89467/g.208351 Transcript_89467/m.208351 type:complete len:394 (-) Transcript_89467:74-1255(-)
MHLLAINDDLVQTTLVHVASNVQRGTALHKHFKEALSAIVLLPAVSHRGDVCEGMVPYDNAPVCRGRGELCWKPPLPFRLQVNEEPHALLRFGTWLLLAAVLPRVSIVCVKNKHVNAYTLVETESLLVIAGRHHPPALFPRLWMLPVWVLVVFDLSFGVGNSTEHLVAPVPAIVMIAQGCEEGNTQRRASIDLFKLLDELPATDVGDSRPIEVVAHAKHELWRGPVVRHLHHLLGHVLLCVLLSEPNRAVAHATLPIGLAPGLAQCVAQVVHAAPAAVGHPAMLPFRPFSRLLDALLHPALWPCGGAPIPQGHHADDPGAPKLRCSNHLIAAWSLRVCGRRQHRLSLEDRLAGPLQVLAIVAHNVTGGRVLPATNSPDLCEKAQRFNTGGCQA